MATSLSRMSVLSHVSTKQITSGLLDKQRATSSSCLGRTLLQLKYRTESDLQHVLDLDGWGREITGSLVEVVIRLDCSLLLIKNYRW